MIAESHLEMELALLQTKVDEYRFQIEQSEHHIRVLEQQNKSILDSYQSQQEIIKKAQEKYGQIQIEKQQLQKDLQNLKIQNECQINESQIQSQINLQINKLKIQHEQQMTKLKREFFKQETIWIDKCNSLNDELQQIQQEKINLIINETQKQECISENNLLKQKLQFFQNEIEGYKMQQYKYEQENQIFQQQNQELQVSIEILKKEKEISEQKIQNNYIEEIQELNKKNNSLNTQLIQIQDDKDIVCMQLQQALNSNELISNISQELKLKVEFQETELRNCLQQISYKDSQINQIKHSQQEIQQKHQLQMQEKINQILLLQQEQNQQQNLQKELEQKIQNQSQSIQKLSYELQEMEIKNKSQIKIIDDLNQNIKQLQSDKQNSYQEINQLYQLKNNMQKQQNELIEQQELAKENKRLKLKVNEYKNKLHICNQKLIELLQYKQENQALYKNNYLQDPQNISIQYDPHQVIKTFQTQSNHSIEEHNQKLKDNLKENYNL